MSFVEIIVFSISDALLSSYKDPRVCSCHFADHDKKNGPSNSESSSVNCESLDNKVYIHSPLVGARGENYESANVESISREISSKQKPLLSKTFCNACTQTDINVAKKFSDAATNMSKNDSREDKSTNEQRLLFKIDQLEKKISSMNLQFEFRFIEDSDTKVLSHTGLPSKAMYDLLFETLSKVKFNYYYGWKVVKIPPKDQLLMTLMKLRMNLRHFDLAQRFGCSISTVSNIVRTWILVMHEILFKQLMSKVPSRKKNQECLPAVFLFFSDCKMIIDCLEMRCDKPLNMALQRALYSAYKHYNTCKALVGIAPNGILTYISQLYPGSTSDKKIVQMSGVLEHFDVGDLILADKGFLIEDILPYGVRLNVPPLLTDEQFTKAQVRRTEQIARARVHVERRIKTIKDFDILRHIPAEMFNMATEIFQVSSSNKLVIG